MLLNRKVRALAFSAVITALSVVLLLLSAVVPGGKLALCAMAGLLPAAAVISFGWHRSLLIWAAVSLLGFLLVPQKGTVLIYALLLGYYPAVKSRIERLNRPIPEVCLKLAVFYIPELLCWFCFRSLVLELVQLPERFVWLCLAAGGLVFLIYDRAFSGLIDLYIRRIYPYFKSLEG